MKEYAIFITAVLLAFFTMANAQDFRYGKVSKLEISEQVHSQDSSANAAVLYKKEDISFVYYESSGFTQEREVYERIKIYNKEGYNWATKKLYLYDGGGGKRETIQGLKGITYNLKEGKIIEDKLRNDGIFEEEYNEFTDINTLTMPNIQDGSVIEYTYKIISPFYAIDDIYFQNKIPINKLEVKIATPQYLVYNKLANLQASFFPKLTERKDPKSFPRSNSNSASSNSGGRSYSKSNKTYTDNVSVISEANIPAIKIEAYAGNIDNYISKMSLELAAIVNDYGIIEESYSTSWEEVSKRIYESPNFGDQLKKDNFFKDDISSMTANVDDPFLKALLLSEYVKTKVKWNSYLGYSALRGVRQAYKDGEGNVADINLLLIAMLRSQGVDANPVLISTKDNGVPLYPTRKGFNYVICMVEKGDSYILLDATESYSTINVLPERALNWQGRVIKEDQSSKWIEIMPFEQSKESTSINIKIEDDFSITGKVRQHITSYLAMRYRKKYDGLSDEDYIKSLEKDKGDITISNVNLENSKELMKPVIVTYEYKLNDAIDDIGGNLYFSPLLFLATNESPFKLDKREYPIDFSIPFEDNYKVNIMLPNGYKVESLPKSEIFEFKNGEAQFSCVIKENGNFIQIGLDFNLKNARIDPEDYLAFKAFFEKTVEKQAEKIILTKV